MSHSVLVRYGMISEVARFADREGAALARGMRVVVRSHRGVEIGTLLEHAPRGPNGKTAERPAEQAVTGNGDEPAELCVLRTATTEDERAAARLKDECEREFPRWRGRIDEWKLRLELIDLEWTLDKSKLILYVLNERGPECTKLALQAAAAGLGIVEVQPVGPDGPLVQSREGSCGTGHCGSTGGSGGHSNGCCD